MLDVVSWAWMAYAVSETHSSVSGPHLPISLSFDSNFIHY